MWVSACGCLQSPEEGTNVLGSGDTGGYKSPCSCWEPNSGPLKDWYRLLTDEPSLQPINWCFEGISLSLAGLLGSL